jgi:hypothetical protein
MTSSSSNDFQYQTIDMNSSGDLNMFKKHFANMDDLPTVFHGINISSFGDTRNNPFMKLKIVAENRELPYEERVSAIRYMQRIPHVKMLQHVAPLCFDIISDDRYPINERYYFFSNNSSITKLDSYIVKDCHEFFFKFSKDKKYPIFLRLFSAKFIYYTYKHDSTEWNLARIFIIDLALDAQESVHIRSEAADCLYSRVNSEDYEIGYGVIKELGKLYSDNKLRTIYTNAQNVHDETISESVMNVLRNLLAEQVVIPKEFKQEAPEEISVGFTKFAKQTEKHVEITTDEIYQRLSEVIKTMDPDGTKDLQSQIGNVYYKMIVNPSHYEGLTIVDILLLIWKKIQSYEHRIELEKRLVEELCEMDMTCSTGYLTRLVNVLSGYVSDEKFTLKMNVKDQLRSNIFARLHANISLLPQSEQEIIVLELSGSGSKDTVKEFIQSFSIYDELYEEFTGLISYEEFNSMYDKCISDFIGN